MKPILILFLIHIATLTLSALAFGAYIVSLLIALSQGMEFPVLTFLGIIASGVSLGFNVLVFMIYAWFWTRS